MAKHPVTKPRLDIIQRHEEDLSEKIDELVQRSYSDVVIGRKALGAFAMPVDVTGSNTPTV